MLVALAECEGDGNDAIDLTIGGAPLKTVATAASVPIWLRRLPPEAFEAPFHDLPDNELFRRRIANHLPRSPKVAASWLAAVRMSAHWGGDDLAVWIAREVLRGCRISKPERLQVLSLYSCYSRWPHTVAHQFLRRPFHVGMGYDTAFAEAESWREAVALSLDLSGRYLDPWLTPAIVTGFEFVPLTTAHEIRQEARLMRNCVRQLGYSLVHGWKRLWSIRHNGERVATLSIGLGDGPILDILQLKGPANIEAPKAVWVAARRWV
ncbi:MAG TPA: hypothetical protein VHK44_09815, partial [Xanthobacteraceae bacterium]|nr:hypothetical protein [Xanthobacteraceae bacterium]